MYNFIKPDNKNRIFGEGGGYTNLSQDEDYDDYYNAGGSIN